VGVLDLVRRAHRVPRGDGLEGVVNVLRSDQIFEGMLIRRLSWPEGRRFRVREVGVAGLRGTIWEDGHAIAGPNAFISWRPMDVPPSQRGFVIWEAK